MKHQESIEKWIETTQNVKLAMEQAIKRKDVNFMIELLEIYKQSISQLEMLLETTRLEINNETFLA